jgi:hypothetical protein
VLTEDTYDWYANDKDGNVWNFGEKVDNYKNGKIDNHQGSWEAGVDGAKPGIIMPADPKVGQTYRHEYYKGKAEDLGTILATAKKVTVAHGTFDGCLQIRNWSTLDTTQNEHRYYCPGVTFLVLKEDGGPSSKASTSRAELVSVTTE